MDYLRRNSRILRMDGVFDQDIRRLMKVEETITERIEQMGLRWFGYVIIYDDRWPKISEWQH